ncbi:DUF4403 family protein [Belliella sp. DSM 111904]|uniref:DUF4403 family protein n=1 Tax=Belliella filtrata TaxID=2923435 RepID=A0ABS9UUY6_9BACT|nr:DUF4403 family protein [Belliella filtrata]MCH7407982.1 DUF4403 family protein [Belliella filtrata]
MFEFQMLMQEIKSSFMKNTLKIFILLIIFSGCKSINPSKPKYVGEPVVLPKATSEINIPIEIPLSQIEKSINEALSTSLFADRGMDLGGGFMADIDVNKTGTARLQAKGSNKVSLALPMNMIGNLKFEKRIFGQNLNTAIPFNENLIPEISFIPKIGSDWDFSLQNINIEGYGRSMKYNLLGFEVDLDPIIRKHLQKMLDNQLDLNSISRFDFKALATDAWETFSKPIELQQDGVSAFIYTQPTKLKVTEEITSDQKLKLYLGIEGEVFSQVGSAPVITKKPLPNLQPNENKENKIDIMVPLAISYDELDQYLIENFEGQRFRTDKNTVLEVSNISSQSYGDRILLHMDFIAVRRNRKEINGEMYLVGKPTFDSETESIRFDEIAFDIQTKNILARSATWMKQGQVLNQIKKMASYPIGDYLNEARRELRLQSQLRTEFADFSLINPQLDVEGIYCTEEDIRIYLRSTGKMNVKVRGF